MSNSNTISYDEEMENLDSPYYGMFTSKGNKVVSEMVDAAIEKKLNYNDVVDKLMEIADEPGCEEAYDTAVREEVYGAMKTVGLA